MGPTSSAALAPPATSFLRFLGWMASPPKGRGRLSVLIYHRVLPDPDPLRPGDITEATFQWQMAILARCFQVLPLEEAVRRLEAGTLPAWAASVTFDDGYADNHDRALPILKDIGIPATFFVTTGTLGRCMWNDEVVEVVRHAPESGLTAEGLGLGPLPTADEEQRLWSLGRLLDRLRTLPREERDAAVVALQEEVGVDRPEGLMMSPDQIRALRRAGMGIGAHTVTHPILARIRDSEAQREIMESRAVLEDLLGEEVALFAYPNGKPEVDYGPKHVAMVRQAGFRGAVSTAWGTNRAGRSDPFQLRRFTPWDRTPTRFVGRLLWQSLNPR